MEQELLTLTERLSLPRILVGFKLLNNINLVFCVVLCRSYLYVVPFPFGHLSMTDDVIA